MKLSDIHVTLSEIRKERNLAQRDIADALNVEQATVSLYETGKRGIPLDLLDTWLQLLEIDVKITPKGYTPTRPDEETKEAIDTFNALKKRRNYLIAEMRALMADKIAQAPEFREIDEETGEGRFWPYSLFSDPYIGLLETRCDHPSQRFLAVEYTVDEVNIYRHQPVRETAGAECDSELPKADRIYFSEDDFLTMGECFGPEGMERRKITIMRKKPGLPNEVELVEIGGFSLRSLLEIQKYFEHFTAITESVERGEAYQKMDGELDTVMQELIDIALHNRLQNGVMNPEFIFWTEEDLSAIDIPLCHDTRGWSWIEEGVKWTDEHLDLREITLPGVGSDQELK